MILIYELTTAAVNPLSTTRSKATLRYSANRKHDHSIKLNWNRSVLVDNPVALKVSKICNRIKIM